ncbi:TPA: ead/Ea22-like family protein [Salmonella enterica]
MSNIDKQALRTDMLIVNALETAKQLRELQESPVAESIFESIVENENGKEIQFERPISDLAYAAFLKIESLVEALEAAERSIAEQSAIVAAAEKLVRCKGRYHSELNYRALAKLFGVITPDLPPLEHENVHYADAAEVEITALRQRIAELEAREVTLPQRLQPGADGYDDWYVHSEDDGEYLKADDVIEAIRAAGIKVKGE